MAVTIGLQQANGWAHKAIPVSTVPKKKNFPKNFFPFFFLYYLLLSSLPLTSLISGGLAGL